MPHGSLTPLARQLRLVLFSLRPAAQAFDRESCLLRHNGAINGVFVQTTCRGVRSQHTVAASKEASLKPSTEPLVGDDTQQLPKVEIRRVAGHQVGRHQAGRRQVARRQRADHLTHALRHLEGEADALRPSQYKSKVDLSYQDVKGRYGRRKYEVNRDRHASDRPVLFVLTERSSLSELLASYLHQSAPSVREDLDRSKQDLRSDPLYTKILQARGFDETDLAMWADMVKCNDSYDAACKLRRHVDARSLSSVPWSIFLYLLRRPYISARALRILFEHASRLVDARRSSNSNANEGEAFLLFARLLRHTREVAPELIKPACGLLLRSLPLPRHSQRRSRDRHVADLTYVVNKAMLLVAQPTAVAPFKDIAIQEAAIVELLQFMANHSPSLQLNRDGYRAVTMVQLAQKKTGQERQWAELKALSWPPWKEDRTRMDAEITPEHGVTKAGDTLRRMQDAGYALGPWERTAELYTGWDVDRTPTIQVRHHLGGKRNNFRSGSAIWEARIRSTRTIQEAWACYLAFEDSRSPTNQAVLLAIVEKLHREERRRQHLDVRGTSQRRARPSDRPTLLPGDVREIQPLPPSTHLYTYTRSKPPDVYAFFCQLRERKIPIKEHCLAYMVTHASSLQNGVEYLRYAQDHYPQIRQLLQLDLTCDFRELPSRVYTAYISLLCRWSNIMTASILPKPIMSHGRFLDYGRRTTGEDLHRYHPLVQAMLLLDARQPLTPPAWNALLDALGRWDSFRFLPCMIKQDGVQIVQYDDKFNIEAAVIAYRMVCHVLRMQESVHMDPDVVGFRAVCFATENLGLAQWIAQRDGSSKHLTGAIPQQQETQTNIDLHAELEGLLAYDRPQGRVETLFELLFCADMSPENVSNMPKAEQSIARSPYVPRTPGPVYLHAYIRSLGWLQADESLIRLIRWMVRCQAELLVEIAKDSDGKALFRRLIVALRVFLERSWLARPAQSQSEHSSRDIMATKASAQLLRSRAPDAILEEARNLIESVDEWEGWATDEEIEEYCHHRSFELAR